MKDFGREFVQVATSEILFFCPPPPFFFSRLTFNIFLSKRKREKPEIIDSRELLCQRPKPFLSADEQQMNIFFPLTYLKTSCPFLALAVRAYLLCAQLGLGTRFNLPASSTSLRKSHLLPAWEKIPWFPAVRAPDCPVSPRVARTFM